MRPRQDNRRAAESFRWSATTQESETFEACHAARACLADATCPAILPDRLSVRVTRPNDSAGITETWKSFAFAKRQCDICPELSLKPLLHRPINSSFLRFRPNRRWYRRAVQKSPILPLAAAVAAVALGASPALAAPTSPGKHGEAQAVVFPLLAVKGYAPAGVNAHVSHVSHSSHVSGSGGHVSHASHTSHVSSVPAPGSQTTAAQLSPTTLPTISGPAPAVSASSLLAPPQSSLLGSSSGLGSGSPASGSGGNGCAFVVVAPLTALAGGLKRLVRRGRTQ